MNIKEMQDYLKLREEFNWLVDAVAKMSHEIVNLEKEVNLLKKRLKKLK